jgi:O-antigen/teichoic acid export membrane protein
MVDHSRRHRLGTATIATMDRGEYEAYRRHHHRVRVASWIAVIGVSVLCGYAVGMLWSFAVGFVLAGCLALAGLELHLRWDRARWVKRFPELASSNTLRRRYGLSDRL